MFRSHSSPIGLSKNIYLIVICIICLVVLKPARLRTAVEDLSGQGHLVKILAEPWETFATTHHLLALSQAQDELFSTQPSLFFGTNVWKQLQKIVSNNFQGEALASLTSLTNPKGTPLPAHNALENYNDSDTGQDHFNSELKNTQQENYFPKKFKTLFFGNLSGGPGFIFEYIHRSALRNPPARESEICSFEKWTGSICPVHARVFSKNAKIRILLAGDSLMQGLENTLSRFLGHRQDVELYRASVCSTGLSRKDYFDWAGHMAKLINTHDPDLVILFLGGNDAQDIVDTKRHSRGSRSWQDLYQKRAEELAQVAQNKGARLVWVGLPIIGNETVEKYIRLLTARQQAACSMGAGRIFIDTYLQLAGDNGEYIAFLQDENGRHVRIRHKDKIHLSEAGYKILLKSIVPVLAQEFPTINPPATEDQSADGPLATTQPFSAPEGT